jgi:predicted transcriptional regulator
MFAMATTIQVSEQLVDTLKKRKQYDKESYEEVIWNLVEDTMEVNEQTKKEIEQARADIKSGNFYTHEQVKKRLGL